MIYAPVFTYMPNKGLFGYLRPFIYNENSLIALYTNLLESFIYGPFPIILIKQSMVRFTYFNCVFIDCHICEAVSAIQWWNQASDCMFTYSY